MLSRRYLYPPSQKTTGLPVDECRAMVTLRRDVAPRLRRITTAQPKAKTGIFMGPRVYPWGSICL
jgi:hypothetical protein